ncbi:hypothetical protein LE181_04150 [Streptomyces sp. SCA3-4]|uniref:hypothetical protein n=1 Tax=Streptomyces sichuanensis TaxID=2871810 RepID=UPI001CE33C0F|nr:hypothetical protein [Streptomyces sichuanensis]MCA6091363.1 hypothetical protein [Streptomyces sichuanensis]
MAKSRLALKCALSGIVALLFAVIWNQPAYAWTWVRNATVYNGAGLCVQGDAGIDHVRPGVFSGNLAYGNVYARSGGCGAGLTNTSPTAAAVQVEVWKWNGSSWTKCRSTDWKYGPTGVSGGDLGGPYGPGWVFDYGGASSCGAGFYETRAHVYVWDGSEWRGGVVRSGAENVT